MHRAPVPREAGHRDQWCCRHPACPEERRCLQFRGIPRSTLGGDQGALQPTPLDRTEAERICAALDDPTALRFVLADTRDDRVVAYLLAQFAIPEDEKVRYRNLGWTIEDGADCRIAPVVADHLQGNGLGTELLKGALGILRQRGCRHVILFGGTRTSNARAIRAYEKAGFKPAGVFREREIESVDMWLSLK
ncbi:GNAT family N-acetyltransferase [Streptomyces sp. KM273126]|uniref:GNAT family N-acetyltransferase n=1 Tax=Streptomyces sp. KM273126 TaxID=2545247 RepID=UPI0010408E5A|nr:GNAT family N-acetyltransferase [Streptomyces sp. KM273126]MBA2811495.1 GNAT family N-acetyltransferase [Streptomyces sp. KM273126]